jgi:hypothetical protein
MVRVFGRIGGRERDMTAYRLEAAPLLWNLPAPRIAASSRTSR